MRSSFNLEWKLYKMAAGYCLETFFLPSLLQSLVKCLPRFPFSFSVTPLFLQEFYLPQVFQESKYRKCVFKKIFLHMENWLFLYVLRLFLLSYKEMVSLWWLHTDIILCCSYSLLCPSHLPPLPLLVLFLSINYPAPSAFLACISHVLYGSLNVIVPL